MSISLILLAAGNSVRFQSKTPKPYHKLGSKSLLEISLLKMRQLKEIKNIIIVINKGHKKYIKNLGVKKIKLVYGGATRKDSTYIALKWLIKQKKISKVLIHDVARPNFSIKLIKSIIKNSKNNKSVIPVLKINDALKEKLNNKKIINKSREKFFTTQTPQCFNLKEIFNLHNKKNAKYIDDDLSLNTNLSNVSLIPGEKSNFKITDQNDFNDLKNFYKTKTSVGLGFDVHRLVEKRVLMLGGIKIESKLGTLGHSDGDPVLHSVIDALLGACGMGDIGNKFPDNKKKYKDVSSSLLTKYVINEISRKNYFINNIDINIITQTPKISKYKKKIANNISKLCNISVNRINIKGKTTEKLGLIGKEKAIASEVIVSVIKYE